MANRYNARNKVIVCRWTDEEAAFYYGVIKKVPRGNQPQYQIEYTNDNGETETLMVSEEEIDFTMMCIR